MKYELIKSLGNKTVIVILLVLLCVNGLELYYHCKYYRHEITQDDNYSTQDYKNYINEAANSIRNGQDVFLSKVIISEFIDREISDEAYDSREAEFVSYEKYGIYAMILTAVFVIFTIDTERKSRMNLIISAVAKRETKVVLIKQAALWVSCIIINFVFLAENIIVCRMCGGIDLSMKLYNIPGYFGTWFSENILAYKILCTIGICMIQITAGNLIYILACFIKNIFSLIAGTLMLVVAGYYWGTRVPAKYCFMNIFSFLNSECLSKDFILVDMGSTHTYRLWAALLLLFICTILINICSFLIYRSRRTL